MADLNELEPFMEDKPMGAPPDDHESRGRARVKKATLVALSALLVRATSAISLIISVPLTLHYLGAERYGAWMTVSSFVAMLTFADLGMGMGLLNQVADADGSRDRVRMHISISSAFALLSCICVILLTVLGTLVVGHVQIPLVKTASESLRTEVSLAVYCCFASIFLNLPLDVVQRTQLGLQRGNITYLWQWVGNLGALGALCLAIHLQAPLHILVLAYAGTPLVTTGLNFFFFLLREPDLRPQFSMVRVEMFKKLLGEGLLFCVLQMLVSTFYNMDNVILGNVLGGVAVAKYSTAVRLFNFVQTLITLYITSLWPAFRESHASGDSRWIRKTYNRSISIAILISLAVLPILTAASPFIIKKWTNGGISVPISVLLARGVFLVVDSFAAPSGVLLSSLSRLLIQILFMATYVGIGFLVKPHIVQAYGLSSLAWFTSLSYLAIIAVPMAVYINRSSIWQPQALKPEAV